MTAQPSTAAAPDAASPNTAGLPHPLVVRTVALASLPDDLGALVDLLPDTRPLAWVRRGDGIVGWGRAARLDARGPARFAEAEAAWHETLARAVVRDEVGLPGTGPVAFGSFAFDDVVGPDEAGEPTADPRPGGTLVIPRVVVGRRDGHCWLTTIDTAGSLSSAPSSALARTPHLPVLDHGRITWHDGAQRADDWTAAVAEAVAAIRAGRLEKVVLARDVVAHAEEPIDPRRLLRRLAAAYPACWTFSVDAMVGATPELLVRSERGLVTSRVLAGTIPRAETDDASLLRAAQLARSSKDLEEHEYAVASVAHALAPYCSSMNVPDTPFVLHLPNVMHLASDVTGVLDRPDAGPGPSSLALAAALHPSAAVCGTPTEAARALIRHLEGMDRGRYAGPVGWLGADGDGEWGIALRSAELQPDGRSIRLFAGCGIVAASDPAAELAESEAKLEPLRYALGG